MMQSHPERQAAPPASSSSPMLIAALFVLGGIAILLVLMNQSDPAEGELSGEFSMVIGRPLTGLQLQPLVGDPQPLTDADLKGRVSLINFWGTWCPPCRMELPHLVELRQKFREKSDFQFVSVSCAGSLDNEDPVSLEEETKEFLTRQGYNFPVHYDPAGRSRTAVVETMRDLGNGFGYPTTLLIDREGVVRGFWPGYAPGIENEMQRLIEKELQKAKT